MPRGGAIARAYRPRFVPDALYDRAFALWGSQESGQLQVESPAVIQLAAQMSLGHHIFPRSAMDTVLRCQPYDQAVKPTIAAEPIPAGLR